MIFFFHFFSNREKIHFPFETISAIYFHFHFSFSTLAIQKKNGSKNTKKTGQKNVCLDKTKMTQTHTHKKPKQNKNKQNYGTNGDKNGRRQTLDRSSFFGLDLPNFPRMS